MYRSIPSEYFEAKTISSIPINTFPRVYVPTELEEPITRQLQKQCQYQNEIIPYHNNTDIVIEEQTRHHDARKMPF